jgi:hypothetical protein
MKHQLLPLTAFITATLSIFGCGGSDDSTEGGSGSSCKLEPACGGDITGNWKIVDFCPDTSAVPEAIQQICESAKLEYDEPSISGTIAYKADKTYTQTASASGTGYLVLDQACLKQGSVTLTCKQIEDAINEKATSKVQCSASGSGCRCGLGINQKADDEGAWAVTGQSLSVTAKGGTKSDSPVCVKADKAYITLTLSPDNDAAYTFKGQLQLQKQ